MVDERVLDERATLDANGRQVHSRYHHTSQEERQHLRQDKTTDATCRFHCHVRFGRIAELVSFLIENIFTSRFRFAEGGIFRENRPKYGLKKTL